MKVILLKDVAKIGRRSNIVEVPDGYALNQLIPKGMAQPATPANLKRVQKLQADKAASKEAGETRFDTALQALRENVLLVPADSNEQGHLFKAVSVDEIVAVAHAHTIDIEGNMLHIDAPIKSLGEHQVMLVVGDKKAEFSISVIKK